MYLIFVASLCFSIFIFGNSVEMISPTLQNIFLQLYTQLYPISHTLKLVCSQHSNPEEIKQIVKDIFSPALIASNKSIDKAMGNQDDGLKKMLDEALEGKQWEIEYRDEMEDGKIQIISVTHYNNGTQGKETLFSGNMEAQGMAKFIQKYLNSKINGQLSITQKKIITPQVKYDIALIDSNLLKFDEISSRVPIGKKIQGIAIGMLDEIENLPTNREKFYSTYECKSGRRCECCQFKQDNFSLSPDYRPVTAKKSFRTLQSNKSIKKRTVSQNSHFACSKTMNNIRDNHFRGNTQDKHFISSQEMGLNTSEIYSNFSKTTVANQNYQLKSNHKFQKSGANNLNNKENINTVQADTPHSKKIFKMSPNNKFQNIVNRFNSSNGYSDNSQSKKASMYRINLKEISQNRNNRSTQINEGSKIHFRKAQDRNIPETKSSILRKQKNSANKTPISIGITYNTKKNQMKLKKQPKTERSRLDIRKLNKNTNIGELVQNHKMQEKEAQEKTEFEKIRQEKEGWQIDFKENQSKCQINLKKKEFIIQEKVINLSLHLKQKQKSDKQEDKKNITKRVAKKENTNESSTQQIFTFKAIALNSKNSIEGMKNSENSNESRPSQAKKREFLKRKKQKLNKIEEFQKNQKQEVEKEERQNFDQNFIKIENQRKQIEQEQKNKNKEIEKPQIHNLEMINSKEVEVRNQEEKSLEKQLTESTQKKNSHEAKKQQEYHYQQQALLEIQKGQRIKVSENQETQKYEPQFFRQITNTSFNQIKERVDRNKNPSNSNIQALNLQEKNEEHEKQVNNCLKEQQQQHLLVKDQVKGQKQIKKKPSIENSLQNAKIRCIRNDEESKKFKKQPISEENEQQDGSSELLIIQRKQIESWAENQFDRQIKKQRVMVQKQKKNSFQSILSQSKLKIDEQSVKFGNSAEVTRKIEKNNNDLGGSRDIETSLEEEQNYEKIIEEEAKRTEVQDLKFEVNDIQNSNRNIQKEQAQNDTEQLINDQFKRQIIQLVEKQGDNAEIQLRNEHNIKSANVEIDNLLANEKRQQGFSFQNHIVPSSEQLQKIDEDSKQSHIEPEESFKEYSTSGKDLKQRSPNQVEAQLKESAQEISKHEENALEKSDHHQKKKVIEASSKSQQQPEKEEKLSEQVEQFIKFEDQNYLQIDQNSLKKTEEMLEAVKNLEEEEEEQQEQWIFDFQEIYSTTLQQQNIGSKKAYEDLISLEKLKEQENPQIKKKSFQKKLSRQELLQRNKEFSAIEKKGLQKAEKPMTEGQIVSQHIEDKIKEQQFLKKMQNNAQISGKLEESEKQELKEEAHQEIEYIYSCIDDWLLDFEQKCIERESKKDEEQNKKTNKKFHIKQIQASDEDKNIEEFEQVQIRKQKEFQILQGNKIKGLEDFKQNPVLNNSEIISMQVKKSIDQISEKIVLQSSEINKDQLRANEVKDTGRHEIQIKQQSKEEKKIEFYIEKNEQNKKVEMENKISDVEITRKQTTQILDEEAYIRFHQNQESQTKLNERIFIQQDQKFQCKSGRDDHQQLIEQVSIKNNYEISEQIRQENEEKNSLKSEQQNCISKQNEEFSLKKDSNKDNEKQQLLQTEQIFEKKDEKIKIQQNAIKVGEQVRNQSLNQQKAKQIDFEQVSYSKNSNLQSLQSSGIEQKYIVEGCEKSEIRMLQKRKSNEQVPEKQYSDFQQVSLQLRREKQKMCEKNQVELNPNSEKISQINKKKLLEKYVLQEKQNSEQIKLQIEKESEVIESQFVSSKRMSSQNQRKQMQSLHQEASFCPSEEEKKDFIKMEKQEDIKKAEQQTEQKIASGQRDSIIREVKDEDNYDENIKQQQQLTNKKQFMDIRELNAEKQSEKQLQEDDIEKKSEKIEEQTRQKTNILKQSVLSVSDRTILSDIKGSQQKTTKKEQLQKDHSLSNEELLITQENRQLEKISVDDGDKKISQEQVKNDKNQENHQRQQDEQNSDKKQQPNSELSKKLSQQMTEEETIQIKNKNMTSINDNKEEEKQVISQNLDLNNDPHENNQVKNEEKNCSQKEINLTEGIARKNVISSQFQQLQEKQKLFNPNSKIQEQFDSDQNQDIKKDSSAGYLKSVRSLKSIEGDSANSQQNIPKKEDQNIPKREQQNIPKKEQQNFPKKEQQNFLKTSQKFLSKAGCQKQLDEVVLQSAETKNNEYIEQINDPQHVIIGQNQKKQEVNAIHQSCNTKQIQSIKPVEQPDLCLHNSIVKINKINQNKKQSIQAWTQFDLILEPFPVQYSQCFPNNSNVYVQTQQPTQKHNQNNLLLNEPIDQPTDLGLQTNSNYFQQLKQDQDQFKSPSKNSQIKRHSADIKMTPSSANHTIQHENSKKQQLFSDLFTCFNKSNEQMEKQKDLSKEIEKNMDYRRSQCSPILIEHQLIHSKYSQYTSDLFSFKYTPSKLSTRNRISSQSRTTNKSDKNYEMSRALMRLCHGSDSFIVQRLFASDCHSFCLFVQGQWRNFEIENGPSAISQSIQKIKHKIISQCLSRQFSQKSWLNYYQMITGSSVREVDQPQKIAKALKYYKSKIFSNSSTYNIHQITDNIIISFKPQQSNSIKFYKVSNIVNIRNALKEKQMILECVPIIPVRNNKVNVFSEIVGEEKSDKMVNIEQQYVQSLWVISSGKKLADVQYHTVDISKQQPSTFQLVLEDVTIMMHTHDHQPFKFILYKQTAQNEYELVKQASTVLRYQTQKQKASYLLIVQYSQALEQKIEDKNPVKMTIRYVGKQQASISMIEKLLHRVCSKAVKSQIGGYQNQKNKYIPNTSMINKFSSYAPSQIKEQTSYQSGINTPKQRYPARKKKN